jgi:hypothetical protein
MSRSYTILMPVYNDWEAAAQLLCHLNHHFSATGHRPKALLINDGSTRGCRLSSDDLNDFDAFESVTILSLGTNLGHQRAIAIGIAYLASQKPLGDVLVMDSDGEDAPADVQRLVAAADESAEPTLILALRAKRSENLLFRVFYFLYTSLFLSLTGYRVRFGNFSFIPKEFLPRLACMPELWNHYAAAIIKSRLPRASVATARATRLDGVSKMNFVGLVLHGLSAISVFSDVVGVRLLCLSLGFAGVCLLLIFGILFVRFSTAWAIPGWATTAVGIATLLFTNALLLAVSFVFFTLSNRTANSFVPIRDYQTFVENIVIFKPDPT